MSVPGVVGSDQDTDNNEINGLLRIMLAQALNQQDRNQVAQLYETIRSVSNLDQVHYYTTYNKMTINIPT